METRKTGIVMLLMESQTTSAAGFLLYVDFYYAVVSAAHKGFDHLDFDFFSEKPPPSLFVAPLGAATEHGTLNILCHWAGAFSFPERDQDPVMIRCDFFRDVLFQKLCIV